MTDTTELRRLHDRAFGAYLGQRSSAEALSERSIALGDLTTYLREHGASLLDEIERLRADVARMREALERLSVMPLGETVVDGRRKAAPPEAKQLHRAVTDIARAALEGGA